MSDDREPYWFAREYCTATYAMWLHPWECGYDCKQGNQPDRTNGDAG